MKPKRVARPFAPEPTAIVAEEPTTLSEMETRLMSLRRLAKINYVSDPQERGIDWHRENDRDSTGAYLFKHEVKQTTFDLWSVTDGWVKAREEFWAQIEAQVLTSLQDEFAKQKIEDLAVMHTAKASLTEYLMPLKERDGTVRRWPIGHKYEGLPMYPLEFGRFDRFIEAYLKLDERMMLKRGEAIQSTQQELQNMESDTAAPEQDKLAPARAFAKQYDPQELRAMARAGLEMRMKHQSVADVQAEEVANGEGREKETI